MAYGEFTCMHTLLLSRGGKELGVGGLIFLKNVVTLFFISFSFNLFFFSDVD